MQKEREGSGRERECGLLLASLDQYTLPATTQSTHPPFASLPHGITPRPLCSAYPPTSPHFKRLVTITHARIRNAVYIAICAQNAVVLTTLSFPPSFQVDWPGSTLSMRLTSNWRTCFAEIIISANDESRLSTDDKITYAETCSSH